MIMLHIILCKRRNWIWGLIFPIIAFVGSLIGFVYLMFFNHVSIDAGAGPVKLIFVGQLGSNVFQIPLTLIFLNIPTFVFLLMYLLIRKKQKNIIS